ncbi:hypothetical protein pb186bvf_003891 [Paramecium bursaria]
MNQNAFLSAVSKSKSNIVRLTIKRDLPTQFPELKKKLKHKKKRAVIESIRNELKAIQNVVFRFSDNKTKQSTLTDGKSVSKFSDSLVNIYRLNAFTKLKENKVFVVQYQQKKQVLLPTQPNPKSKTQQKLKIKKQRNQERRKKRTQLSKDKKRQQQREKTFALKNQQQRHNYISRIVNLMLESVSKAL